MSGIWTPHVTESGDTFYFNSTLNISSWSPLPGADVLTPQFTGEQFAPLPTINSQTVASNAGEQRLCASLSVSRPVVSDPTKDIQRRIDEALAKKQAEAVAAKREKVNNADNTSELTEAQLSYIAQKSALEAQSGSKGEESGKWLVR
mmetsp:Transcript_73639/g.144515  ORF Transcript_73639/g.144515 Transcript_73639/m.144515 type:complete len:147 (+) Transcript_73639:20-460(+)